MIPLAQADRPFDPEASSSQPTVSVIIPTYNRASLVQEAIASVLKSSYSDYELIVADDGSKDETVPCLVKQGFFLLEENSLQEGKRGMPPALPSNRILLKLSHSGYPGRVRNRGALLSRGTYLAFLDSDDLWLPHKLEQQLSAHRLAEQEGKPYRISHTRELWIREGKQVSQRKQKHQREGDVFTDSLRKCILGPSTVVLSRSLWVETGGFREDLEIAEDYEFWVRITTAEPVLYIPEPLTVKRAGWGDQLSEAYGYIEPFRLIALKDLVENGFFEEYPERKIKAVEELIRKCRIHLAGCKKRGKTEEATRWEQTLQKYTGIYDTLKKEGKKNP
jgi:glycosyltransferase involved in cell wall biosynthesis